MHITKISRSLTLGGFAPAGKLNHAFCGLPPVLELLAARLGKLNWGKRACGVFVLCIATAIALPAQTFTSLFSFDSTDGFSPEAALVQATNGDLYGTTDIGGANCSPYGCGTIFRITPSGALTTLYSFCSQSGCPDGQGPEGLVEAANGDFYGTTHFGGANTICPGGLGCGTIFKITPSGALTTLYNFCSQGGINCTDGEFPEGPLVQATSGDFYGTTEAGGSGGTVFKITPTGTLTTLYTFCSQTNCTDGQDPRAGLVQATSGDFYGTTYYGGNESQSGTVFRITPTGTLTKLYNFCSAGGFQCTDGASPQAGLVQATNGHLYGTTQEGGTANSNGTIFELAPNGALTTLLRFCTQGVYPDCPDGSAPMGLAQGTDGNLYGTTVGGGTSGYGTIFKITLSGTLTTLYSFFSQSGIVDSANSSAGPVQDTNGEFYGTTPYGGTPTGSCSAGCGTVFSLSVGLGPFVESQTTSGEVGRAVRILGSDLTGATSVSFNGTAATFTVVSRSLITTTVPAGATSGRIEVVTPIGTLLSNVSFRVLP